MSFTPGPNNILLTASGVNFGFVRSIPHILGVKFGFVALVAACGLGLGLLFTTYPVAQTALKIVGAGYLLWLAWKVANAGSASGVSAGARPISFLQATAFQWVNPKGVIAAVGAVALFVRPEQRHHGSAAAALHLRSVHHPVGHHLDSVWRRAEHAAAQSALCARVQYRHGGPAGGQHRADGLGRIESEDGSAGGCRGQPSPLEARPENGGYRCRDREIARQRVGRFAAAIRSRDKRPCAFTTIATPTST